MPISTSEIVKLSGASTDDIKNWRRRKVADEIPEGKRGIGTEWGKSETLVMCWMSALIKGGLPVAQASILARRWWLDKVAPEDNSFPRFYARNVRTGQELYFEKPDLSVQDFVAALSDSIAGGWASDGAEDDEFQFATSVVFIDRHEIVRRVEAYFGRTDT